MKRSFDERQSEIAKGLLQGATKGGAAGAAASLVTGAAVILSAPAWLPIVGGTMAVSAATVAIWTAGGAVIGAFGNATRKYFALKKRDEIFKNEFGIK
jgi:hypothetical protein